MHPDEARAVGSLREQLRRVNDETLIALMRILAEDITPATARAALFEAADRLEQGKNSPRNPPRST